MPADLLARIAKALEADEATRFSYVDTRRDRVMANRARELFPEAAAALQIAVEALEKIAGMPWGGSAGHTYIAREALSRLTSAAEGKVGSGSV